MADNAAYGRRCPFSAIGGLLGEGVQRPQSNVLWASFDDTEGGWGHRERHIEGGYRLGETFQSKLADFFERRRPFDRDGDRLSEQDLSILGLSAQPRGEIANSADCGIPDRSAKPIWPRVA